MADSLDQTEKAFQKQDAIFVGKFRTLAKKNKKDLRFVRNIGLGFKVPKEAVEGTYIDKKCPFTGQVSIRGRILKGIVVSTKMNRTIVIRRDYLRFVKKYRRFEKRHKTLSAHCSPAFRVKEGDVVTVGQCRPLSKTVRFNVLKVEAATEAGAQNAKKAFQKQDAIFVGKFRTLAKKNKKELRFVRRVGLGIKTPKEAIEGTYIDKKCPFTGSVSIRGRILKGVVISTKMNRTLVIRRDYLRFVKKYRRFEKRHKTLSAHCSPAFRVKEGDVVTVGQCRPLSKTVRFNVLKVEAATEAGAQNAKKAFRVF